MKIDGLQLFFHSRFTLLAVLNVITGGLENVGDFQRFPTLSHSRWRAGGVFVDNAFRSADKQQTDIIQKD